MNIVVIIISRNNPAGFIGLVNSLNALASGSHQIEYVLRLDSDDNLSIVATEFLPRDVAVKVVVGPRPESIGKAINDVVPDSNWNVVTSLMDDGIPITRNWDHGMEMVLDREILACMWNEVNHPAVIHPILTRKYYEAIGRRIFPEWFPFWFADTWVGEVHELVYGRPLPTIVDMKIDGKLGRTARMRDLSFWVNFFIETRILRLKEAEAARGNLGLPEPDLDPILNRMSEVDLLWPRLIPKIEAERQVVFGGEPSPYYVEAKHRAERWLSKENSCGF